MTTPNRRTPLALVTVVVAIGSAATVGLLRIRAPRPPARGVAAVTPAPALEVRRPELPQGATAAEAEGRRDGGYTFTSALSLADMRARLDSAGPLAWSERESHWYGDYLGTQTLQERAVLKIVRLPGGGFGLDAKLRAPAADVDAQWAWLEATITANLLPAVEAHEARKTGAID